MSYVIRGLSATPFQHLYGMTEQELEAHGAKRYICDASPGFPDRIEMRDAEIGEKLLLINHVSMDKNTPYKASHAIFILEGAEQSYEAENEIPKVMFNRLLSLRAFDAAGMMVDAAIAREEEIEVAIKNLLKNPEVEHVDAHNAHRGCFAATITRS